MCPSHGEVLLNNCSGAKHLFLVAPYMKADVLSKIVDVTVPFESFICITKWTPQDLAVGASDAECRTIVKNVRGKFLLHPSLHAKYYRIDHAVLIGSANLTNSALGWAPHPNFEILCRPSDDFDATAFENELLQDAREISDEEFQCWQAISKIRANNAFVAIAAQPRLDIWRPATRDPRHLALSYQGREDQIASFDEQTATLRDLQNLLIPSGLSDEELRMWASVCLLSAPFTNSVIQLLGEQDDMASYRLLAETYGLGLTEARRDTETVQSWLAYFAPEILDSYRQ